MLRSQNAAVRAVLDVRRANLRTLADRYEGAAGLGRALGYTSGSYISQMIGLVPSRPVSEAIARTVESKLGLPAGWLDITRR